jgi:hypothetical protein
MHDAQHHHRSRNDEKHLSSGGLRFALDDGSISTVLYIVAPPQTVAVYRTILSTQYITSFRPTDIYTVLYVL